MAGVRNATEDTRRVRALGAVLDASPVTVVISERRELVRSGSKGRRALASDSWSGCKTFGKRSASMASRRTPIARQRPACATDPRLADGARGVPRSSE